MLISFLIRYLSDFLISLLYELKIDSIEQCDEERHLRLSIVRKQEQPAWVGEGRGVDQLVPDLVLLSVDRQLPRALRFESWKRRLNVVHNQV